MREKHSEATLTKAIFLTWPSETMRPRYITAIQVNNGAGFAYGRTIDAIVFDTWPSGGLHLHGLEIKTTKADLRRELQDTQKFAEFAPHLDLFSIVAPKGVVDITLLPAKWGLYSPTENGSLRARRKPLMLHDEGKRKTISRSIAAAFVRALVSRSLSSEAREAEYARGYENGEKNVERETKRARMKTETVLRNVKEFERASGVSIAEWGGERVGEAVKLVMTGGLKKRISYSPNLRELARKLLLLADDLDSLVVLYDEAD
jgi:hypothetical protein